MFSLIERSGRRVIEFVEELGRFTIFIYSVVAGVFSRPFGFSALIKQIEFIGARSMSIVLLSGLFTGMVLALLFYSVLTRLGSVDLMGSAVGLSLIQELGPVMTAIMVIARVGSSTCAEIAIMRNEQQFDALTCMAINPYRYVMAPRFLSAIISVPLLTAIFNVVGILGGYIVGVYLKGLSGSVYLQNLIDKVTWEDLRMSIIKSFVFAVIFIMIAMSKGFYVHLERGVSGAEAVSRVTTNTVVASAIAMLFADYISNSFLI